MFDNLVRWIVVPMVTPPSLAALLAAKAVWFSFGMQQWFSALLADFSWGIFLKTVNVTLYCIGIQTQFFGYPFTSIPLLPKILNLFFFLFRHKSPPAKTAQGGLESDVYIQILAGFNRRFSWGRKIVISSASQPTWSFCPSVMIGRFKASGWDWRNSRSWLKERSSSLQP